jgi:hypothetical protein
MIPEKTEGDIIQVQLVQPKADCLYDATISNGISNDGYAIEGSRMG